jgi:hypothetical protein
MLRMDRPARWALGAVLSLVAILVPVGSASADRANAVKVVDRKEADAGKRVKLLETADFKVTGSCEDDGGGQLTANTFLAAKRNNLAYSAYSAGGTSDDFDADFDEADPKLDITSGDASGADPAIEAAEYYEFYAEGRGGRPLRGRAETTVHTKGADCGFSGVFTGAPGGGPVEGVPRIEADAGQTVVIFANRDFKVTGTCDDNGGGNYAANTYLRAKRGNQIYYLTEYDLIDTDFGPNDGPVDITPAAYDPDGTLPYFQGWSFDNEFFAVGKDGGVLQARLGGGVHTKGADCTFSGIFTGPGEGGALDVPKLVKADAGDRVTLFANDDFKVTGSCVDNGGGDFTADTFAAAERKNLLYYAYNGDPYYDVDFDPNDGKADISSDDASGTAPSFYAEDQYSDFYGEGKGGEVLAGRVAGGVHVRGADCVFTGYFAG